MAVCLSILWLLLYRDPEKHPRLSDEERAYIVGDEPTTALPKPSMKDVLAKKQFWGIATARFLTEPAWQTFSFWIPLYMVSSRGMDIKQFALFAWLWVGYRLSLGGLARRIRDLAMAREVHGLGRPLGAARLKALGFVTSALTAGFLVLDIAFRSPVARVRYGVDDFALSSMVH